MGIYTRKERPKTDEETEKTLKKQLELLSERSKDPDSDLPALTHAMVEIIAALQLGEPHSLTE